ncbi:glycosyltransferase family 2 protein [Atopobium fossor]|uniref:glycosyltransferase family 2 protein n=1 Tax=Atopobium fossor TaxID=39487 RepID=UPI00040F7B0A|nr:glycosyltransferase family 2 protein [Atopobium fossor]
MTQKILSFGIPCFNSAEYMDRCITSILEGAKYAEDIQIIIVDDGSVRDNTAQKADEWEQRYPELIRAVHQPNGGHGMAVLAGLQAADGTFYKVVDSDDWLDKDALAALLDKLRQSETDNEHLDLVISNYVYEHTADSTRNFVSYRSILPVDKIFAWNEVGHFHMWQNLLMHSLCYRTDVLRANGGTPLPAHTFYVDNIYAFVPLPRCERLYYLDVDLYRYFIGREDQSVNETVMAGRIDQQVRVTRIMMKSYHLYKDIKSVKLRSYMVNYFIIMMAICSVFSKLSDHEDAMDELAKLWNDLREYDYRLYRRCRWGIVGVATNLPTKLGTKLTMGGYRIAGKVVKFN